MKFVDPALDPWRPLPEGAEADAGSTPGDLTLLSLSQWEALRARAGLRPGVGPGMRWGLRLPNDADVAALRDDLPRLALLVLDFPKWTDGRAYSQARTLRARLGWGGELRAAGQVLVDMLPLLQRTGFDAVQLRPDQRLDSAERALRFFAGHYQGDVVEPRPLFRREPAAA
jgi:uncharacterized protein (DUF934 family)